MLNEEMLSATVTINKPIAVVWALWTQPLHIANWNCPSDEWTNTRIENELEPGKSFLFAMAKKDGSEKFDFTGTYDTIITHKSIAYTLDDGRKTIITFTGEEKVQLTETFVPVTNLDFGMQQEFCQAVLDKFKQYATLHQVSS